VFVRAEVVDDAMPGFAVNHVRIEPPCAARRKRPNPRNGLAAEAIDEGVVPDREGDVASRLREHDASPAANAQERLREGAALPDFIHDARSNRRDAVSARESESSLHLRMEAAEIRTERSLIN